MKKGLCKQIQTALKEHFPQNPYWEKWNRGRPSKAQLEKREQYWQWQKENTQPVGFLKKLINGKGSGQKRKVNIIFNKRGNEND